MKQFLILVLLLWSFSGDAQERSLKFLLHGKPVNTVSQAELEKLVPPVEITVYEPHELKDVTYKGFMANALLDRIYGPAWRNVDDALFTCSDGYQPTLSIARFHKYEGMFAFERVGQDFALTNMHQGNEKVTLAPYYLVWNSIKAPEMKTQKGEGWPYQVTTVDLVDAADRFPHMTPPKHSSAAVKRGFAAFREHCFACHKVNGDGGDKSIDLNRPVSVTDYWKENWLKRWVLDPSQIRPGTAMPGLALQGKQGDQVASDIIAYLKTMRARKN